MQTRLQDSEIIKLGDVFVLNFPSRWVHIHVSMNDQEIDKCLEQTFRTDESRKFFAKKEERTSYFD